MVLYRGEEREQDWASEHLVGNLQHWGLGRSGFLDDETGLTISLHDGWYTGNDVMKPRLRAWFIDVSTHLLLSVHWLYKTLLAALKKAIPCVPIFRLWLCSVLVQTAKVDASATKASGLSLI